MTHHHILYVLQAWVAIIAYEAGPTMHTIICRKDEMQPLPTRALVIYSCSHTISYSLLHQTTSVVLFLKVTYPPAYPLFKRESQAERLSPLDSYYLVNDGSVDNLILTE